MNEKVSNNDKLLFIILFRTLKEFGYYSFKLKALGENKEDIIKKCIRSNRTFCGVNFENESLYYNMSIWPYDIGLSDELFRLVFISRIINSEIFDVNFVEPDFLEWICKSSENHCDDENKYNGCIFSALKKIEKNNLPDKFGIDGRNALRRAIEKYGTLNKINENTFIIL